MNVVSFIYSDHQDACNSAPLVQERPGYSETPSLFRTNGTSMATAITSGEGGALALGMVDAEGLL